MKPTTLQKAEFSAEGMRVVPASLALLDYENQCATALADALGVSCPGTWPPLFNGSETRAWLAERLHADLENASWYIIAGGGPTLAGIAGYKGPPGEDEVTEIGYAVVETCQRRGIASTAVANLCRRAFAAGAPAVAADTLPGLIASQTVLLKNGFTRTQMLHDQEEGSLVLLSDAVSIPDCQQELSLDHLSRN